MRSARDAAGYLGLESYFFFLLAFLDFFAAFFAFLAVFFLAVAMVSHLLAS